MGINEGIINKTILRGHKESKEITINIQKI